ncbi:hypothetical protein [Bacillus cereus]|uniref:hypothetical protein n=1 Tax=Bacillus cereus TaxID=1396 RepID=UPI000BFAD44B|nr:hypothetical protein [Bacillus cereus]PFD41442.1 hypothetical protein CN281_27050 [Bacillus cereus]
MGSIDTERLIRISNLEANQKDYLIAGILGVVMNLKASPYSEKEAAEITSEIDYMLDRYDEKGAINS